MRHRQRNSDRRLAAPGHSPGISKASSNDSMKINIGGDDSKSPTLSSRPISASISYYPAERNIEDITNLSLDQGPALANGPNQTHGHVATSSLNPLKRSAAPEAGSPDYANHSGEVVGTSRSRRAKAASGEAILPKGSDFDRIKSTSRVPGGTRERPASKTLFDPNTDGASGSSPRRSGYGDAFMQSNHPHLLRPEVVLSKKDASYERHNDSKPSNRSNPPGIIETTSLNMYGPAQDDKNVQPRSPDEPEHDAVEDQDPEMLIQPETRPISHEQLVTEVKGIYAGLVMVEAKCIDVDEKQSKAAQERDPSKQIKLTAEQWQALIALHKTLLHEHHDFFLASQHPSASSALSKLAAKYSMPARMWRHGIHAFLEVLRHRLPDSLDHMLAFIYIAYSMMALLFETVPAFEDTWIECLGDLGRYRMAIEDDDIRDREVWAGVAQFWYSKATDKRPNTGRLYHHLAILARPYTLQQSSLYTRSLTCIIPFESARGSIMTLFNPILEGKKHTHYRSSEMEVVFIKAHALLFTQDTMNGQASLKALAEFVRCLQKLFHEKLFDGYTAIAGAKFKEQGVFAALTNISSLLEYGVLNAQGSSRSILRLAFDESKSSRNASVAPEESEMVSQVRFAQPSASILNDEESFAYEFSRRTLYHASDISFWTLSSALQRIGDRSVFPLVHVYLVFLFSVVDIEKAMRLLERDVPWSELADFLNALAKPETMTPKVRSEKFPRPSDGIGRPLPEDFLMRGQLWSEFYFPGTWFSDAAIDDEERALELPSMAAPRLERILWLGHRIAAVNQWLVYDHRAKQFSVTKTVENFPEREIRQPIPFPARNDRDSAMVDLHEIVQADPEPTAKVEKPAAKAASFVLQTTSPRGKGTKASQQHGKAPSIQPTKILSRDDVDMPDVKPVKSEEVSSPRVKLENTDSKAWFTGKDQTKATGPQKVDPDDLASDQRKLDTVMIVDSIDLVSNKD